MKRRNKSRWKILVCIIIYILLFVPFEKWLNIKGILLSICTALRIIILFGSLVIGANMSLSGIICLLLMMSTFIIIYSSFYFDASVLIHYNLGLGDKGNIINSVIIFFRRNIIVMMIGIMILVVLFGVGKSFEWSKQDKKHEKINKNDTKFCQILKESRDNIMTLFPIFGYIVIMITVIYSYAGMYAAYNNMYYEKYNYFCNKEHLIKTRYINLEKEELFEIKEAEKLYEVRARYNSLDADDLYEEAPEEIIINVLNKNGSIEDFLILKNGFSINGENEFNFGTAFTTNYFYFSTITYLTIGYGDIVPLANEMKYIVATEGIIAHLLTIIFVPILMTLLQELYVRIGKKKKG